MIPIQPDEVVMNQQQAAEFTKLSAKTLERMALAGEDIGRMKVGRRVLFMKSKLAKYFADKAHAFKVSNPTLN